jgi:hypothetical protein
MVDIAFRTLKRDLAAYKASIEAKNPTLARTLSNRFSANSIFIKSDSTAEYAFFSLILRTMAEDMLIVHKNVKDKDVGTIIKTTIDYIDTYIELIPDIKKNINKIYTEFYNYEVYINDYIITELERKVYEQNMDISKEIRFKLISLLIKHWKKSFDPNYNFLAGTLNELQRTYTNHGFNEKELYIYLIIRALQLIQPYYYHHKDKGNKIPEIDDGFVEMQKKVLNLLKDLNKNEGFKLDSKKITIIHDIIHRWRIFFLFYTELQVFPFFQAPVVTKEKEK